MPVIVVIGIAALRRMCRRISWRPGMPRLTAVCTCSRSPSSRIDGPGDPGDDRQRGDGQRDRGQREVLDVVQEAGRRCRAPGTSRSCTANTRISTIAATNAGIAAETAVITSVLVSSQAGPQARPAMPRPMPITQMIRTTRTAPGRPWSRSGGAISVDTFSRSVIEMPEVAVQRVAQPVPVLGQERLVQVVARARGPRGWPAGSDRPPDSAAIGLPGARYIAAKMTKLAISRLATSIASLRAKNSSAPSQPAG